MERKENTEDMKYYLCYIRMVKLVPNSNLLCKSCSKRSYFSLWPVALLPPVKKFDWEWEKEWFHFEFDSQYNSRRTLKLITKTTAIINER
jgi:hypothetical protein